MNFKKRFFQPQFIHFGTLLISTFILPFSAQANCADQIASLDLVQPAMERHWQQLQQKTSYDWGTVRPYRGISGDRITLTPDFDRLTGAQKQQVLLSLRLGYNDNWIDLLTPQEQQAALQNPGLGALSPYQVYASDGRAVSLPYDGCTRMTLLTEKARFSWYTQEFQGKKDVTPAMLRNAGQPFWRLVKFPIAASEEQSVRQKFWQVIGHGKSTQDWWIAWVPEHGYFEINVPQPYEKERLEQFLQIAPKQYHYVTIANDGTPL